MSYTDSCNIWWTYLLSCTTDSYGNCFVYFLGPAHQEEDQRKNEEVDQDLNRYTEIEDGGVSRFRFE